jgi:RNA polymerase sigma-70 factor (ECF subfamily)
MRTPATANSNVTPIRRHGTGTRARNDAVLMRRVAAGDKTAMKLVFSHHHMAVYRLVLHRLRDKALAEDVTSDVFLDVWRQAARFEGRSTVLTWILAIAYRKAAAARPALDQLLSDRSHAEANGPNAVPPDATPQARNRNHVLRRCLATLSAEHREVIDLVYYQKQSIEAVAAILGIPEETAKTRMFYARRRLADALKRRGAGSTPR